MPPVPSVPSVKESSDALNPPAVTRAAVPPARRKRTARDRLALAVATCGVGLIPVAPGTWGSAVGLGLYLALGRLAERAFDGAVWRGLDLSPQQFPTVLTTVLLLAVVLVSLAGTWAATRCETLLGKKDPGAVVVDEVAGQLITFLFVPWGAGGWLTAAGFVAFRVFEIWKPYPVRRLEALKGGLGIMADDVLAGAYAATLMSLLTSIRLLF